MSAGAPDAGLAVSLRRLLASVLEVAKIRLELLATEYESEKLRIFDAIVWVALALMFATSGLVLGAGFIVLSVPPSLRAATTGVLALVCVVAAVWLALQARRHLANIAGPITATVDELRRDRSELAPDD